MKHIFYMPLTAAPFKQDHQYKEVLPQNPGLSKYIRCFWGAGKPFIRQAGDTDVSIVIPDTCVDIIYYIDYTENTVAGGFCGINDASFLACDETKQGHLVSIFAIRFYAWGAYAFSEDSLKGTVNGFYDIQSRFCQLDRTLGGQLSEKHSLEERCSIAEDFFSRKLSRARHNDIIESAVGQMIAQKGRVGASELAKMCFVSSRHLERLFHEYIGITPKKLCNLVRYQCLWNEILRNPRFSVQDAVCQYGYTDQSHLMREFKRYHTMDIAKAKMYAYQDVGNIQYVSGES